MRLRVRHVLAAALLLAACGGRYSRIEGDDDGGSGSGGSGQAGSKPGGKAGQSGKGGSSSPAGGSASAGASTMGGKTGGCACPDLDCPPGYEQLPDPSGCCYVCVPLDCRNVACPGIACGSGSRLEYPPDQCCPICVPDDCNEQRRKYSEFRKQILDRYNSFGCMIDSDCSLLYEGNACSFSCGVAVPTQFVMDATVNLDNYAAMACQACPLQPAPPCEPSLPPACFNGRCTAR